MDLPREPISNFPAQRCRSASHPNVSAGGYAESRACRLAGGRGLTPSVAQVTATGRDLTDRNHQLSRIAGLMKVAPNSLCEQLAGIAGFRVATENKDGHTGCLGPQRTDHVKAIPLWHRKVQKQNVQMMPLDEFEDFKSVGSLTLELSAFHQPRQMDLLVDGRQEQTMLVQPARRLGRCRSGRPCFPSHSSLRAT